MGRAGRAALAALLGLAAASPAGAAEAGREGPGMILNLLASPVERPEAAWGESLRRGGVPGRSDGWEVLPDGSARWSGGRASITIKNPCPPGDLLHEVKDRPLPGRNRK